MFKNAGGFGYVLVLVYKIQVYKIKYGRYVTVSNKKLVKVENPKNILFHSKPILSTFFVKRLNFDSTSAPLSLLRPI